MIKTIEWTDEGVRMIDQRKLPTVEEYPVFRTYEEVFYAFYGFRSGFKIHFPLTLYVKSYASSHRRTH